MAIDRLSAVSSVAAGDLLAVFSQSLGADARVTITALATLLQTLIAATDDKETQYAAPSATGFSVTVTPTTTGGSVFLLLTPAAGYAAGTILMPASAVDRQEVLVHCTQAVTTLTVGGNGNDIAGAPATVAANGYFRMRFDGTVGSWYRVG
jgi:hypothetical protein